MTILAAASRKIPLNMNHGSTNNRYFPDGSYIKVFAWERAPEAVKVQLEAGLLFDTPELVILCPRSCDQFGVEMFSDSIGSDKARRCMEIQYEGVATLPYLVGRD